MNWDATGPKLFFPNVVFTLIRSGIKRAPNIFTFRVPLHLTKPDIKAYLEGLYNVKVDAVETTTFIGRLKRQGTVRMPNKKTAVVQFDAASLNGFKWPNSPSQDQLIYPLDDRRPNYPVMRKK